MSVEFFHFAPSLWTIANALRWPVVACVTSWSSGKEVGSVSRQQGWAFENTTHCSELTAGRTLQPSEMKLWHYGQTLLCCIFVVSSL